LTGRAGGGMKLADFGPEPIQVTGYFAGKPPSSPGGIRGVTKAEDFYNATRRQAKPWAYSVFCVAAPAAVLASALLFIANAFSKLLTLGSPVVSIERFCVSPFFGRPLANVVTASALHFAAILRRRPPTSRRRCGARCSRGSGASASRPAPRAAALPVSTIPQVLRRSLAMTRVCRKRRRQACRAG